MSMKIKNLIILASGGICLPLASYFVLQLCVDDVRNLIYHTDFVYLNWRVFPILSGLPLIIYIEMLIFSCFFSKDKKSHPSITKHMTTMAYITCALFFPSVLIGPAINIGLAFSSWHSCPVDGGFQAFIM